MNIKWSILFATAAIVGCGDTPETTSGAGGGSTSASVSASASTTGGGGMGGDPVPATPEEVITKKINDLSADPQGLRAFLVNLPKGGDLHSHISRHHHRDAHSMGQRGRRLHRYDHLRRRGGPLRGERRPPLDRGAGQRPL